jgi:hypothetical protein
MKWCWAAAAVSFLAGVLVSGGMMIAASLMPLSEQSVDATWRATNAIYPFLGVTGGFMLVFLIACLIEIVRMKY